MNAHLPEGGCVALSEVLLCCLQHPLAKAELRTLIFWFTLPDASAMHPGPQIVGGLAWKASASRFVRPGGTKPHSHQQVGGGIGGKPNPRLPNFDVAEQRGPPNRQNFAHRWPKDAVFGCAAEIGGK